MVRGYNVMTGYLDDPEQTAEAIDADGWLHTGDVGVMDERGYIQITDRLKDMFITGGFNAYPAEIEDLLLAHPGIGQAAVIGIPDERMGEVGMAFVIPRAGVTLDPAEVIAWSRGEHGQLQGAAPGGDRDRAAVDRVGQGQQGRAPEGRRRARWPTRAQCRAESTFSPNQVSVSGRAKSVNQSDTRPMPRSPSAAS